MDDRQCQVCNAPDAMSEDFKDQEQNIQAFRCIACGALAVVENEDPELIRWYRRVR